MQRWRGSIPNQLSRLDSSWAHPSFSGAEWLLPAKDDSSGRDRAQSALPLVTPPPRNSWQFLPQPAEIPREPGSKAVYLRARILSREWTLSERVRPEATSPHLA